MLEKPELRTTAGRGTPPDYFSKSIICMQEGSIVKRCSWLYGPRNSLRVPMKHRDDDGGIIEKRKCVWSCMHGRNGVFLVTDYWSS